MSPITTTLVSPEVGRRIAAPNLPGGATDPIKSSDFRCVQGNVDHKWGAQTT